MWNWLKRLFGGDSTIEDRSIQSEIMDIIPPMSEENPNFYLQNVLGYLVNCGELKEYKCVNNFMRMTVPTTESRTFSLDELNQLRITKEIRSFVKRYRLLKCKCANEDFSNWIKSVNVD